MKGILAEISESEVEDLLGILYAANDPVAENVADRIMAAVVSTVDREGKEVDAFEGQIEIFINNLKTRLRGVPDDTYTEGQLSAYNYSLALYREHLKGGPI